MGEFSLTHLLLLAVIVLIFFGPSRLPALGQSLGKAIRGFKQGLNEIDAEAKNVSEVQNQIKKDDPQQLKSSSAAEQAQSNAQKETDKNHSS